MTEGYDSRPETLRHSLRVGALIGRIITQLVDRSTKNDLSKTEPPELAVFNEFTPKLKNSTYGTPEYAGFLQAMGDGLRHHYENNRHHPEYFPNGIAGMSLVDLVELLADWKAATERHSDGDLYVSLDRNQRRFGMTGQLTQILFNTARDLGWMTPPFCGAQHQHENFTMRCNVRLDGIDWHWGPHADGEWDGGQFTWDAPGIRHRIPPKP